MCSVQSSSICRAALHAGVMKASGGYVDILAMNKKKSYTGSLKNGVQSERYLLLIFLRSLIFRVFFGGAELSGSDTLVGLK